jgi:hypothetical protein
MKNSKDTIGNRTRDLPACSAVPHATALPLVPMYYSKKKKSEAVPLQAWSGPEGSRKLSFPDFLTTAQHGGKVVILTHRPPLPPGNTPGTHFC